MHPVAIVFDLFGTLLDIRSLETAASAVCADPAALVTTWREKQLGYAFAATIMKRYEDFDSITSRALEYAAARHGAVLADGGKDLTAAWCRTRPYPDALPALAALREVGIRCAVLTNGTPATAAAAIANADMTDAIDVTLSVDRVRAYKPDRRVYALVTEHYQTRAEQLVFVTANGWDATGAADAGLRVAWCNRSGLPAETFGLPPAWTLRDLRELSALVGAGAAT